MQRVATGVVPGVSTMVSLTAMPASVSSTVRGSTETVALLPSAAPVPCPCVARDGVRAASPNSVSINVDLPRQRSPVEEACGRCTCEHVNAAKSTVVQNDFLKVVKHEIVVMYVCGETETL